MTLKKPEEWLDSLQANTSGRIVVAGWLIAIGVGIVIMFFNF